MLDEKIKLLSKKELKYFRIMKTRSGVLYITSKPGIAKSAISKSIANKLEMEYYDLRLSMRDETDVGLYPKLVTYKEMSFLDHVVPLWAYKANEKPTVIHFEELNRASLPVRNAALQILLDRQIGDFKFNDNVYFIASGNLGSEDGTDVEEFDAALNNRLIHIKHTLDYDEWVKDFAGEYVYSPIVEYLNAYRTHYYVNPVEGVSAFATPRSWTFLSDFIIENLGKNANVLDVIDLISDVATGYIGNTAASFISYLQSSSKISIHNLIEDFDKYKSELALCKKDKINELLVALRSLTKNVEEKYNDTNMTNIIKFLSLLSQEERASYLLYIVDKGKTSNPNILKIIFAFKEESIELRKRSQNQDDRIKTKTKSKV